MVRINIINPKKLADQHLVAEYNEILMLIGHIKKFPKINNPPKNYTLDKGHINFFKNKKIISPKYGDLGMFVIPIAWISIFFSVVIINIMAIKTILKIRTELIFMNSINFEFTHTFEISRFVIERFIFNFLTNQIVIFILFFMVILWTYIRFANKNVGKTKKLKLSIIVYFSLFSVLFSLWWIISIIYVLFNKKVKWR